MGCGAHYSAHRLDHAALDRAINGVPRPVLYKGGQVGAWREHDERLTMFLRNRRRGRFGAWLDKAPIDSSGLADEEGHQRVQAIEKVAEFADIIDRVADEDADALPA